MAIFWKIEPMCLDGLCYFERHHFYENRGKKGQGGNIERQVELNENENLTCLFAPYIFELQDNLSYPSTLKRIKNPDFLPGATQKKQALVIGNGILLPKLF